MLILRRILQVVLIVYWLFVLVATHIPTPPRVGPEVSDKLLHFLAYGLLAGLLFLTVWVSRPNLRHTPLLVMVIVMVYGVLDEVTQPIFGRGAEWGDWLADCGGAGVAVVILGLVRHLMRGTGGARGGAAAGQH